MEGFFVLADSADSHISEMYPSKQLQEAAIEDEKLRDLEAESDWVAYAGEACDHHNRECNKDNGFLHVYQRGQMPKDGQNYQDLTETIQTQTGEAALGWNVAVDSGNDNVVWNGYNSETNYSLGGSTLPGTDYFIVSYGVSP